MKTRARKEENPRSSPVRDAAVAVAVIGEHGSFSEEAAFAHALHERLQIEPVGFATPEEVLAAMREGRVELAVLPVANSSTGIVTGALAALLRERVELVGEVNLPIRHALLVRRPGIGLEALERVASHPQALLQCARFLERALPGRARLDWSDTASAARALADGELDEQTAVLASRRAARFHGLHVLEEEVQDDPANRTCFAVVRAPRVRPARGERKTP
jgi:prephenate dehydratase